MLARWCGHTQKWLNRRVSPLVVSDSGKSLSFVWYLQGRFKTWCVNHTWEVTGQAPPELHKPQKSPWSSNCSSTLLHIRHGFNPRLGRLTNYASVISVLTEIGSVRLLPKQQVLEATNTWKQLPSCGPWKGRLRLKPVRHLLEIKWLWQDFKNAWLCTFFYNISFHTNHGDFAWFYIFFIISSVNFTNPSYIIANSLHGFSSQALPRCYIKTL